MAVDVGSLRTHIAGLEADSSSLEGRIADLRNELARKREQLEAAQSLLATMVPRAEKRLVESSVPRSRRTAAQNAYEVLKAVGKPMHYVDLYEEMVRRGIEVPGEYPKANLNAHLNLHLEDGMFARFGRGIYGLAEWDKKPTA